MLLVHKDILLKLKQMKYLRKRQGEGIDVIFKYLKKTINEG